MKLKIKKMNLKMKLIKLKMMLLIILKNIEIIIIKIMKFIEKNQFLIVLKFLINLSIKTQRINHNKSILMI